MFTPSGRIGGSELGCGVLQGAPNSLETVDLSVALLRPLNQSNMDSKFFISFCSFFQNCICVDSSHSTVTGICSLIPIQRQRMTFIKGT